MAQQIQQGGMWRFTLIWFSQMIALLGSCLTGFALGIWIYQRTSSITLFALFFLCNALPRISATSFADTVIKRYTPRFVMLVSDSGILLCVLTLTLLSIYGQLAVWCIYLVTIIASICSACHLPAYKALTTQLVPQDILWRTQSMIQIAYAAQVVAPLFAGVFMSNIGILGILGIDLVIFLVAIVSLFLIRIPPATHHTHQQPRRASFFQESLYSIVYMSKRPGLFWLIALVGMYNFIFGVVSVLIQPLILSLASVKVLGVLMFLCGSGMVAGSLTAALWSGPRRRAYGVIGFMFIGAMVLCLHGLTVSIPIFGMATPCFFFTLPIVNSCSIAILKNKVMPNMQEYIIALTQKVNQVCLPLAYLVTGLLADRIFAPLLKPNGLLTESIGHVIGIGPDRGIALMFIVVGVFGILIASGGYLQPRLRLLEEELPDIFAGITPAGKIAEARTGGLTTSG